MKKILPIIIALVAFSGIANAQISIKKSDVGRARQVATLAMYWSWIYQIDSTYYLVMKSDNQFDDSYWLRIGETKDECIGSLNSLKELAQTITDSDRFEIDNGEHITFIATQYKSMGIKGVKFQGRGHAGIGYILPSNLDKAIKWIEKNVN